MKTTISMCIAISLSMFTSSAVAQEGVPDESQLSEVYLVQIYKSCAWSKPHPP